VKLIKGQTGEIGGIKSTHDGTSIATFSRDDPYINIWDLKSEEKIIVAPKHRVNTGAKINCICIKSNKKTSTCLLLTARNNLVQFFKIKSKDEVLKVTGVIKDQGESILSCEFNDRAGLIVQYTLLK